VTTPGAVVALAGAVVPTAGADVATAGAIVPVVGAAGADVAAGAVVPALGAAGAGVSVVGLDTGAEGMLMLFNWRNLSSSIFASFSSVAFMARVHKSSSSCSSLSSINSVLDKLLLASSGTSKVILFRRKLPLRFASANVMQAAIKTTWSNIFAVDCFMLYFFVHFSQNCARR
jgi:hypothetical protein